MFPAEGVEEGDSNWLNYDDAVSREAKATPCLLNIFCQIFPWNIQTQFADSQKFQKSISEEQNKVTTEPEYVLLKIQFSFVDNKYQYQTALSAVSSIPKYFNEIYKP